jgi:hypothetical protein
MQDGGVQVGGVVPPFDRRGAQLVRRPVCHPARDTPAGQPVRGALGMAIAAGPRVHGITPGGGRAPELGPTRHQRRGEQPALDPALEKARDG